MAVLLFPSATALVRLPLACDPVVQAFVPEDLLACFLEQSDATVVPEWPHDVTWITIRPLTRERKDAAERRAGWKPLAGIAAQEKSRKGEALSEAEQAAAFDFDAWYRRLKVEVVCEAVTAVDGWPDDIRAFLDAAAPSPLLEAFLSEAYVHVMHVSALGEQGKALSASALGSDPAHVEALPGTATLAASEAMSSDGAPAADPSPAT